MKARAGLTLIETMIAGAILAFVLTAAFHGIVTATRVCHENARLLAAEAFAWETAWRWLNKSSDNATSQTFTLTDEDCPQISSSALGEAARCVVNVTEKKGANAFARHGDQIPAKLIEVDVEWGAPGDRRSLTSSGLPISISKSEIERNR